MDDMKKPDGIDFFEFLYEVWQLKWLFLGIFLSAIVVAGAFSMVTRVNDDPMEDSSPVSPVRKYAATIPFTIDPIFEPYRRSVDELWQNLKASLPEIEGVMLVNDNHIPEGAERPDYIYTPRLKSFAGFIHLDFKNGDRKLAEKIRTAFIAAAKTQFEQTVSQVRSDIKVLDKVPQNESTDANPIWSISREYYYYYHFLNLSDVIDGSHRFFTFEPVLESRNFEQIFARKDAKPNIISNYKVLILGAIIGFILACVAVMFRIAIKREKLRAARA